MPILKYQAIHVKPIAAIKYVINPVKTKNGKLVSCNFDDNFGTGISEESIYDNFKYMFETFEEKPFRDETISIYRSETSESSLEGNLCRNNKLPNKQSIRIHQYFQSFCIEDSQNMTAEEAHKIGEQFCKEAFGENRSYLVATHTDKEHLHNHILVCPFDSSGKRWYANNESLYMLRKISDRIALEHGLHIIEHPKHKNTLKYYEWLKCQQGKSWKDEMRKDIDIAVINANSFDDLFAELEAKGYTVKHSDKYITLQIGLHKIRSYRLGDGYSYNDLRYRIENKDSIIDTYYKSDMQFEMACYVSYLHKVKYSKKSTIGYEELQRNADLLVFLDTNNIQSEENMRDVINSISDKCDKEKQELSAIKQEITNLQNIIRDSDEYLKLLEDELNTPQKRNRWKELKYIPKSGYHLETPSDVCKLKEKLQVFERRLEDKQAIVNDLSDQKKKAAMMVKIYTKNVTMTDYDRIVEEMKSERERMRQNTEYILKMHKGAYDVHDLSDKSKTI